MLKFIAITLAIEIILTICLILLTYWTWKKSKSLDIIKLNTDVKALEKKTTEINQLLGTLSTKFYTLRGQLKNYIDISY